MERKVGTISRGIRCPIIRQGDDLAKIVVDSVLDAAQSEGYALRDRDVVAVTESVVARSQGNYASIDAIGKDVRAKLGGETVGVIFPILSRNRFAICLRGIARGCKKIVLMLSYPSDEVGNELVSLDKLDEETGELRQAVETGGDVAGELGDVLFAAVKVGRFCGIDPEDAIAGTCEKFIRRFRVMEQEAARQGRALRDMTLEEMTAL